MLFRLMPPKKKVVDHLTLSYSGMLNLKDLYKTIFEFWESKGFDVIEKKHKENVSSDGKTRKKITALIEASKEETDYLKYWYEISLEIINAKLVDEARGLFNTESLTIVVDGYLYVDFQQYFGNKPFNFFLRVLYESYINKTEIDHYVGVVIKTAKDFINHMKKYLAIL